MSGWWLNNVFKFEFSVRLLHFDHDAAPFVTASSGRLSHRRSQYHSEAAVHSKGAVHGMFVSALKPPITPAEDAKLAGVRLTRHPESNGLRGWVVPSPALILIGPAF